MCGGLRCFGRECGVDEREWVWEVDGVRVRRARYE